MVASYKSLVSQDSESSGEHSPLIRHMSMDEGLSFRSKVPRRSIFAAIFLFCLTMFSLSFLLSSTNNDGQALRIHPVGQDHNIISIENAEEYFIEVDDGIRVWYRIWGNKKSGVPILFVHGGPGQAVVDYENGNKRFFSESECFVVEIDQRGTGSSEPSVRDDLENMRFYQNISIRMISEDFEKIRKHLGIEKWLVWGGSFGSTISLDYGMRFPDRCIALILRGIYLDTIPEVRAVYARSSYLSNPKRLEEFDILFQLANNHVMAHGKIQLDPNDALALMQVYANMISKGHEEAIWRWYVFENNLMEEVPENLLDPYVIDYERMPIAQSVSFFETRLWLHASIEEPSNLLQRVDRLAKTPLWICQGLRDEVCPAEYAMKLSKALEKVKAPLNARFIDAGHEDTNPEMASCLKETMRYFLDGIKHADFKH